MFVLFLIFSSGRLGYFRFFLFFWGRSIYCFQTSLYTCCIQILYDCAFPIICQGIFFKFPLSFPCWPIDFFSSMLFSFHVIDFFFFFLWLISSSVPLWSEKDAWYNFYTLKFQRLILCPCMWLIPKECAMCIWKESVLWGFFNVISWKWIKPVLLYHLGFLLPFSFLSRRSVHWCH